MSKVIAKKPFGPAVQTDAEKLIEKGEITTMILNKQPHRVLLDLAKVYKIKGASKMKREDLIAAIAVISNTEAGKQAQQEQFVQAITEEIEVKSIIPDVQPREEVEAVIAEQENWVPTKPPLPDRRFDLVESKVQQNEVEDEPDTIEVLTADGSHDELSQAFIDQLDKPATVKTKSERKPRTGGKSVKTLGKFKTEGNIELTLREQGIKTKQALICAIAADRLFDKDFFTMEDIAAEAINCGLVTKQDPVFIVKYYLKMLIDGGLVVVE